MGEDSPFKYLLTDHVTFYGGCSIRRYCDYCDNNCESCRKLSSFSDRWYYGLTENNFTNDVNENFEEKKSKKKKNKNWRYVMLKDVKEPIPLRQEIKKGNEENALSFALNIVYNYYYSTIGDDMSKEDTIYQKKKDSSRLKKEIYSKRLLKILKENNIEDSKVKYFKDMVDLNMDARFVIELNIIIFLCKISFEELMGLLKFNSRDI